MYVFLFKILPKNLISFIFGLIFRIKTPWPISYILCKTFAFICRINLKEAEKPLSHYHSIEELFTRKLKPNLRHIEGPICSPCDGYVFFSGEITNQSCVQAKGINYNVNDLLCGGCHSLIYKNFKASWCFSIYLAPHCYHRVHSPITALFKSITYIPGKLWPVNKYFSKIVPNLFVQNERVVFEFVNEHGYIMYLVMIGAFNVGRILVPSYQSIITNSFRRQFDGQIQYRLVKPKKQVNIGEEIGIFSLGSTVIIVFDQNFCNKYNFFQPNIDNYPIKMGQKITL